MMRGTCAIDTMTMDAKAGGGGGCSDLVMVMLRSP